MFTKLWTNSTSSLETHQKSKNILDFKPVVIIIVMAVSTQQIRDFLNSGKISPEFIFQIKAKEAICLPFAEDNEEAI